MLYRIKKYCHIVSKEDALTIENHKNICKNSFPVLYLK